MERVVTKVRTRRARPVGSGYVSCSHTNREGYPDPTASCAIKNCRRDKKRLSAEVKDRMMKTDIRRRSDGQRQADHSGDRQAKSR